jgi:hypothetical protein
MVKINLLEGVRPPLPPATAFEIITVAGAALAFALAMGGIAFGIIFLWMKLFGGNG